MTRRRVAAAGAALVAVFLLGVPVHAASAPAQGASVPDVVRAATGPMPVRTPPGTRRDARRTVWVCRPGMRGNPCRGDLDTTVVAPDGTRTQRPFVRPRNASFDCFYVYPTVSTAPGTNAPRRASPEVLFATRAQAAPFQSACRLFVPAYRQITTNGLASGAFADPAARRRAQRDVERAFDDYLRRYNRGRPFLLLGHSQGAFALSEIVATRIDGSPRLRHRMLSAMLIGAGPWLDQGSEKVGTFRSVPPCRSTTQTGCVVAYNTYPGTPPPDALFGRAAGGRRVICTNPASPAGGPGLLDPIVPLPSAPGVDDVVGFVEFTDAVSAECRSTDTFSWLDVAGVPGSPLPGLVLTPTSGPAWGLHRVDVTLALGDLVRLASSQAATL